MVSRFFFLFCILLAEIALGAPSRAHFSPLPMFLEHTADDVWSILRLIERSEGTLLLRQSCQDTNPGLLDQQLDECAAIIRDTAAPISAMRPIDESPHLLELKIWNTYRMVQDEDAFGGFQGGSHLMAILEIGEFPRYVSARSAFDTQGSIWFDQSDLETTSPKVLFYTIYSTVLSVVSSQEHTIFRSKEFGSQKELIEAASMTLTDLAVSRGMLGRGFSISDEFSCRIAWSEQGKEELTRFPRPLSRVALRKFADDHMAYGSYDTGVAYQEDDRQLPFIVAKSLSDGSMISYLASFQIHEEFGCEPEENLLERMPADQLEAGRWSEAKLFYHVGTSGIGSQHRGEFSALKGMRLSGFNPLCRAEIVDTGVDQEFVFDLEHEIEGFPSTFRISCRYLGSEPL